ncbi:MAG: helix-turn-helix domain-containing protein [Bacillota bacterium]
MKGRFHIGRRIAALRMGHGDSLRQAASRTGVSHTTIARIENGHATTSFHGTLRKIAEGYGVTIEYLLTGRDPRQDFEMSLRRLSPEERSRLYFASTISRTRMVLQFLLAEYPQEFPLEKLAEGLSVEPRVLQTLLEKGEACSIPEAEIQRMGDDLNRLTGISRHWFRSGYTGSELADSVPPERFDLYLRLMKKAAQAGIKPDVLEMAIDLLIMKHKEVAAGSEQGPLRQLK